MTKVLARQIIPAQPGYFVVDVANDSGEIYQRPVIAWCVEVHQNAAGDGGEELWTTARPIGVESFGGDVRILQPNGAVVVPESQEWESLEEFRRSELERYRTERAARALKTNT